MPPRAQHLHLTRDVSTVSCATELWRSLVLLLILVKSLTTRFAGTHG